jgi:hypothetical protein
MMIPAGHANHGISAGQFNMLSAAYQNLARVGEFKLTSIYHTPCQEKYEITPAGDCVDRVRDETRALRQWSCPDDEL